MTATKVPGAARLVNAARLAGAVGRKNNAGRNHAAGGKSPVRLPERIGKTTIAGLLARDFRLGIHAVRRYLLGAFLLGLVIGFGAVSLSALEVGSAGAFTYGDIIAFAFDYPVPIDWWQVLQGRPVSLSFEWVFPFAALFACVLDYPRRDILGVGYRAVVRGGSRWLWWLSKCLWCIATVVVFWVLFCAGLAVVGLVAGSEMTLGVTPECMNVIRSSLAPYTIDQSLGVDANVAGLLVAIVVVTSCLALVQLACSLAFERMPAYGLVMSYLLLSGMFQHPLLLGNYLITGRHISLFMGGVPLNAGYALCLVAAWGAIALGGLYVTRMMIFGGSNDE